MLLRDTWRQLKNASNDRKDRMIQVLGLATCFNRKEKTVKAIKNLIKGNPNIKFTFIIVDDGSTDGTKEALGHFMGKEFRASLAVTDEGLAASIEKQLTLAGIDRQ